MDHLQFHGTGPTHDQHGRDVRSRLLDAAEVLFCQKGFERTTIRELTAVAGCNVAAVNYHFGGKEGLYQQMFRRQLTRMVDDHFLAIERVLDGPAPTLEGLVRGLVSPPLLAASGNQVRATVVRLIVREVLDRHVDPEMLVKDLKSRFVDRLGRAVRRFEPGLTDRQAELVVFFLDALILHSVLFMPYYLGWISGLAVEDLIEGLVRFGTAGVRALAAARSEDGPE